MLIVGHIFRVGFYPWTASGLTRSSLADLPPNQDLASRLSAVLGTSFERLEAGRHLTKLSCSYLCYGLKSIFDQLKRTLSSDTCLAGFSDSNC